jgi:deoxyribodipyrimidine photolyase
MFQDVPLYASVHVTANVVHPPNAKAVFWNWDVEPYSQIRDLAVSEALKVEGIEFLNYNWDQLLHSPTEIFSGTKTPYTVYTPFWKNWITKSKAKPVKTLANLENLTAKEEEIAQELSEAEKREQILQKLIDEQIEKEHALEQEDLDQTNNYSIEDA